MRLTFVTAAAMVSIFATAAAADDYPPRKAGLWEITLHNPAVPDIPRKMCIDAETDQLFRKFSSDVRSKHCAKHEIKVTGETVSEDTTCTLGGTTVTTNSVTTYTSDSAYQVDIKMHFDPPKLGQSDVASTQDAKWTGDCPADMKPGDIDLGHGIKFNIRTVNMFNSLLPGHNGGNQ